MSTRVARVVRGLIVAVVALLVAAIAHLAGGGQIGAVGFALAFAFSTLVSIALAGRTVSAVRVAIAVLLSQGMFHLLFGVGADDRFEALGHPARSSMAGMGMPAVASGHLSATVVASPVPENWWMWIAHVLAAAVTIVALVKGERTFWALAEQVSCVLVPSFAVFVPSAIERPSLPRAVFEISAPGSRFLLAGVRHRGPPQLRASI